MLPNLDGFPSVRTCVVLRGRLREAELAAVAVVLIEISISDPCFNRILGFAGRLHRHIESRRAELTMRCAAKGCV